MKKILIFIICMLLVFPTGVFADYADGGKYLDFSDFVAGKNNSYYKDVYQYRGKFAASSDPEGKRGENIKFTVSDTRGESFLHTENDEDLIFGVSLYVDTKTNLSISSKGLGNVWSDADGTQRGVQNIVVIKDGNLMFMGNKNANIVGSISDAGWLDFRIHMEYSESMIHIYCIDSNGGKTEKSCSIPSSVNGTKYFSITSNVVNETEYCFYVDDAVAYYADSPEFSADINHGEITDGMMEELELIFNKDVIVESEDCVSVTSSDGNAVSFDLEEIKNGGFTGGFRLKFDEALDEFGTYTLSLNDGIKCITGEAVSFEEKIFSSEPYVSITPFESDIFETGTLLTCDIECRKPRNALLYLVHNGEYIEVSQKSEFEVTDGENKVYAQITDEKGDILAQSDEITVYGTDYALTEYNTDDDFDLRKIPIMNYAASGGEAEIVDEGGEHGKVLKLVSYKGAESQSFLASNRIDSTSEGKKVVYEGDFKFEDFNTNKSPLSLKAEAVGSTAPSWPALFTVGTTGDVLVNYYDGNTQKSLSVGSVTTNRWYSFKIAVDMKSQTAEWWFDGKKVESGKRPWKSSVTMKVIHYTNTGTGVSTEEDTVMYADNIKSYYIAPNAVYSYNFNSAEPCITDGLEMTVEFSENMDEESLENITLTSQKGDEAEFETQLDGNVLTVKFAELKFDTQYTLCMDGVETAEGAGISGDTSISFKTDKKPFCIKDATAELSGSSLKVNASVRTDNTLDNAVLNVCVYQNGAMIKSKAVPADMTKPGSTKEYSAEFKVAENGKYSVGLYLIDGFENINIVDILMTPHESMGISTENIPGTSQSATN